VDEFARLWQYQQADMEAERFAREMSGDPTRLKLLKSRDFLVQQQANMQKIESDVSAMADRVALLTQQIASQEEQLRDLQETLDECEPESLAITRKSLEACQKLVHQLTRMEQELTKIRKDSDVRTRQQHDVRVHAAKVKAEYDKLKAVYDVEYKTQSEKLKALKAAAEKAGQGISEDILGKYARIKKHRTPPVALLNDDRCGGCNMNLPAVVLRNIRMGAEMVDCENCGRMVIVKLNKEAQGESAEPTNS